MQKEVAKYCRTCETCQKTKAERKKNRGLLQPLPIPSKCWEEISMDFLTHFPLTQHGHSAIYVVVDRLSKMAHFIPTHDNATPEYTAKLFLDHIIKLHGVSKSIVSDRDGKFTSDFWIQLFKYLGTNLDMSSARHPETDGQTEKTIQTLEAYLRQYISYNQKDWD